MCVNLKFLKKKTMIERKDVPSQITSVESIHPTPFFWRWRLIAGTCLKYMHRSACTDRKLGRFLRAIRSLIPRRYVRWLAQLLRTL
jgi:hypothetical protein